MRRTSSSSGDPSSPPAPAADRRIGISLCLGIIFFLCISLKLLLFHHNTSSNVRNNTLQLIWRNNNLAVDHAPGDGPTAAPGVIEPKFTPFFFQPVPINQADAELLESIDGIGPQLAGEILKLRREGVVFRESSDLLRIPGIGARKLRRLEGKFSFAATP